LHFPLTVKIFPKLVFPIRSRDFSPTVTFPITYAVYIPQKPIFPH
jgi:hypothetical protein